MLLSKCPSSYNNSPDDVMTFKIKILSQGSMVYLRVVLKRFLSYIHMDDVPNSYMHHFAKKGGMYAYKESSFDSTIESTKNLNNYYTEKIDLIFNRLNFLHLLHTSLQSKTFTLPDYLNSHLSRSNE